MPDERIEKDPPFTENGTMGESNTSLQMPLPAVTFIGGALIMVTKKATLRNASDQPCHKAATGKVLSPGAQPDSPAVAVQVQPRLHRHAPELGHPMGYGRLSDPGNKDVLRATLKSLSADKEHALRFLQSIGIANADGQLSKRYGG